MPMASVATTIILALGTGVLMSQFARAFGALPLNIRRRGFPRLNQTVINGRYGAEYRKPA